MDLQGRIEKFNVPEIIQLIAAGKRTGTLGITRGDESVIICFKEGRIIYAYSPKRRGRLGDRLVAKGIISLPDLKRTLVLQRVEDGRKRLGMILVEKGLVDKTAVDETLREQLADTVFAVMAWSSGVFKFYDGRLPTPEDDALSLPTENLVLEGARRVDELNRLAASLPEFSTSLCLQPLTDDAAEICLSAKEWQILLLCDGRRSIAELLRDSPTDEAQTLRALSKFLAIGLVGKTGAEGFAGFDEKVSELGNQVERLANLLSQFLERT